MKICLINNLYKPFARGGTEEVVEMTAQGVVALGHKVVVISTKPILRRRPSPIERSIVNYQLPAIYYDLDKLPKALRLFWHILDMFDIGSFFKVRSILKKEKCEAVITHNLKGIGFLTPFLLKWLKLKHIHTLHDIQLIHPSGLLICGRENAADSLFSKTYTALNRFLFGSPDAVVSPSRWLLDFYTKRGFFKNSKKFVIENPVNISGLGSASIGEKPQIPDENGQKDFFRFLCVGQVEEHKGVLFLIKAFLELDKRGDRRCELIIAGGGSGLAKIRRSAGGNKNIKILGRIKKEEVGDLMLGCNCLIVPSLCYENSPTVIYEAFQAGLPIIGSRLGGIPELIDDENFLFKAGDKNDLLDKMRLALKHKHGLKEAGQAGRKKVAEFSVKNYAEKLMSLL